MLLKVLELMELLHLQILKLPLRFPYSASFLMVRCNKSLYAYYSKRLQLYQRISICNISYLYSVMGMGKSPLIKVSLYQNVSCILYNIMVEVEYEKMNSNIDVDTNVLEAVFIQEGLLFYGLHSYI